MRVIRVLAKTDPDGRIRLTFPGGDPGELFDLAVIVVPHQEPSARPTPEELGWPPGFLEKTFGSITDETFEAPPRGPVRPVEALD